ncbi:pentapeptide repeat-containing protein [Actinoallomurus liliacearum]|uniref:pentapeptide repeat-containing protein n=1 Tax=Actinoallomurus liliacearum TaxID=1080073 RepID=UPI003CD072C3
MIVIGRRQPTSDSYRPDLTGIRVEGAQLSAMHLSNAQLTGANLNRAVLHDADLTAANDCLDA